MNETTFDKVDELLSRATAKVAIVNDGWAHGDCPKGTQDVLWQLEDELREIQEAFKKGVTGKEDGELSPRDERLLDKVKDALLVGYVEEWSKTRIEFILRECQQNPTRLAQMDMLDRKLSGYGQNALEILQAELSTMEHEPESRA